MVEEKRYRTAVPWDNTEDWGLGVTWQVRRGGEVQQVSKHVVALTLTTRLMLLLV